MIEVRYYFSHGINCLFELPTEAARKLLPAGIEPVEPAHGASLLGITLFDFTVSPVGPYQELVISLYVVPHLGLTEKHPHGAVFPLVVASTHQEARDHAIDLWHLPHFNEDISIEFTRRAEGIAGIVRCHLGEPIVELDTRAGGPWKPCVQTYQSFQHDESGSYVGIISMEGELIEHEENTGRLRLHGGHRLFRNLDLSALDTLPFREMWMREGVEKYHNLLVRPGAGGRAERGILRH
jgi:hypothetical protein